jgi:Flp pilus assembly protein TadG
MIRRRRGAAAIEFALSLSFLVTVIFGFFELTHLQELGVSASAIVQDAANSAADVRTGDQPPTGAEAVAAGEAALDAYLSVSLIPCGLACNREVALTTVGGWTAVEVTLELPYAAITHVSFAPGSLTRKATAIIQQ